MYSIHKKKIIEEYVLSCKIIAIFLCLPADSSLYKIHNVVTQVASLHSNTTCATCLATSITTNN